MNPGGIVSVASTGVSLQQEGLREDNENEGKGWPSRAVAKDARWRTRLILDS